MNKKNIVILIDGNSYIYRLYYSKYTHQMNKLSNIKYKMLYILKNIILKFKPKKLIIVFDTKGKTFRNQIFTEYKKNRIKMPDDLQYELPKIYKILTNVGIPVIQIPNFEADDVIGTLSKISENHGDHVLIGTCDKDFAQLVNNNIYLLNNIKNIILNKEDIKIKYGVPPTLIIDLLSLVGDISDNIPGVRGIGKKIAITLLLNIGNIKNIYNNLEKIKTLPLRGTKNILNKLKKGKKMAFLSYKLAKIKIDINIEQKYEEFNFSISSLKYKKKNITYHTIIQNINNIMVHNI